MCSKDVKPDGDVLYRVDGHRVTEIGPDFCLRSHPLKYPNVKIGWDGTYRTYTCLTCWDAALTDRTIKHTLRYRAGEHAG